MIQAKIKTVKLFCVVWALSRWLLVGRKVFSSGTELLVLRRETYQKIKFYSLVHFKAVLMSEKKENNSLFSGEETLVCGGVA